MSSKLEQDISKLDYLFNQIKEPIVCVKCSDELTQGLTDAKSIQDYSRIDVGFTDRGLQIWCKRHQLKMPKADFRCLEKKNK